MAQFSKEFLMTIDQDEKVTLVVLLGGVWLGNPFMPKLTRRKTNTLKKLMYKVDDFVNTKDILWTVMMP